MKIIMKQSGQMLMALILIMSVALAIGLSIIQKSLVDISTATKVEESSRAFSAAEAGIEKALRGEPSGTVSFAESQSTADFSPSDLLPVVPGPADCTSGCGPQDGLEYPPLAKEEIAHFWLADPYNNIPKGQPLEDQPVEYYKQTSLEVYWGDKNLSTDKAAIEIKVIYYDLPTSSYKVNPYFYDPAGGLRASSTNFIDASTDCVNVSSIPTTEGPSRPFYCKVIISSLPSKLMLVRLRLLYNSNSQPVAVRATGTCGKDCSIPPQAKIFVSTGTSGEAQRIIKLFQIEKVVPPFFDFAIFSAGEINK